MDELSEEEYEKVLKYMETTGEDNFETATLQLKQYNFNLDVREITRRWPSIIAFNLNTNQHFIHSTMRNKMKLLWGDISN